MNEKVSIIIPVYNANKLIERCINSIINQTYKNIEIICVNDGSTDNSLDLLENFNKNDKRVIVISKENAGVSSARNAGIKLATGKYIMFVDSDDYLLENCIEKFIEYAQKEDSEFIISNHLIEKNFKILNNSDIKNINIKTKTEFINNFLLFYKNYMFNQNWNKLFLREKIKTMFDESRTLGEDMLFNIEYLKNIDKVSFFYEKLYVYNMDNENSITKKNKHTEKEFLELYKFLYNDLFFKNNIKPSFKFDVFVLKHYCSYLEELYGNNLKEKMKKFYIKETVLNKINYFSKLDYITKKVIFSKFNFFIMNLLMQLRDTFQKQEKML